MPTRSFTISLSNLSFSPPAATRPRTRNKMAFAPRSPMEWCQQSTPGSLVSLRTTSFLTLGRVACPLYRPYHTHPSTSFRSPEKKISRDATCLNVFSSKGYAKLSVISLVSFITSPHITRKFKFKIGTQMVYGQNGRTFYTKFTALGDTVKDCVVIDL